MLHLVQPQPRNTLVDKERERDREGGNVDQIPLRVSAFVYQCVCKSIQALMPAFSVGTAYCIWSVISSISNLNR